jgi:predicted aminopeptidase
LARRLASVAAVFLAALLLGGCETLAYYAQAIGGQLSLMSRAQPVERLIADPATPPALRQRLALARAIRDYAAKELALPDIRSYRGYADLERPYAVWNVVAAQEFSLEPVLSCFPVAGCVSYRGFFSQQAAERHAGRLRAEGHDVFVYGVAAYSTLGRFDDPLLSTFIDYSDADLARLIFHELAHQVVYVKNDTTFNESFAVAVEREGVRRWLAATGRGAQLAGFVESQRRNEPLLALLEDARGRLGALYAARLAPEAMRERKRTEVEALGARLKDYPRLAGFPVNNALLASFASYNQLVPAFERLLAEEKGDLARFYERVRALARDDARP